MDNFKENLSKALNNVRKTVTKVFAAPAKTFLIIATVVIIILFSIVASYDALLDQFSEKVGEHMENNPVQYDASDGSIIIEDEQVKPLEDLLDSMGTSKEKLHITTEDLKKIYAAEVVTQEINRGVAEEQGKYYGRVYVKKATTSTEKDDLQDLTYIDFEQFQQLSADEITNYFSVDGEQLCLANVRSTTDNKGNKTEEINIQKISYKNLLTPYMMPVEFLLDLCIITENPEFVMALADKVLNETEIIIAVMQKEETITTTTTITYQIETDTRSYTVEYDTAGNYIDVEFEEPSTNIGDRQSDTPTVETSTTITPTIEIVYVKSWFIELEYTYNKLTTTVKNTIGPDDPSNKMEDEPKKSIDYTYKDTEFYADGNFGIIYESKNTRRINQQKTVTITTTTTTYQQGITKEPLDKADEFLTLLKTPFKKPESFVKEAPIGDIVSGAGILLQMLQNSERTQAVEHIMRYILYVYTGDNYGVKELDLSIFEPGGFTTISNNNLSTYLRQFSHSGEAAQSADGNYYLMYGDGVGWPTIGNADLQWKSHYTKFNVQGKVLENGVEKTVPNVAEYVNSTYLTRGPTAEYTDDEIYQMQIYIEKELVDTIGDSTQESYYNTVVNATSGLNLSRQQLYALTAIAYNFGHLPERNGYTFKSVYQAGAAQYEINSWQHNKFIWDNWWCALDGGAAGHIPARDAAFETYVKGIYDFSQSDAGEVFGRNYYIYYTQEQLNRFDYAPNKPITRTSSNESEIFEYEENATGTNGITNIGDLELATYTNSAGRTFVEYKQNTGPWATMSYGNGTIAAQGCSITSLAIALSGYGYDFTPQKWSSGSLISMSGQMKSYLNGSTRVAIGAEGTANVNVKAENKQDIQSHLKTGDIVIIHVLGNKKGYSNPYTSNQHWMALLDINEDGSQVYVSNPYAGKSNGWADIDQVLNSLCCYIKVSE